MKNKWFRDEEAYIKKKKIIILSIIAVALIISVLFFILNHYQRCTDWDCFDENLAKCKKTKFAGGSDIMYGYIIEGKNNGTCEVSVTLLEGQLNNKDTEALKNKEMTCYINLGVVNLPESDLSKCHGDLKEALQEQVISQLYTYIVQNIGQLNRNLINSFGLIDE
jgi:hypothetical protein